MKGKDEEILEDEEIKFLSPRKGSLRVRGAISYDESKRAWSIIRIKREIREEFPQLLDKMEKFGYVMTFYRSFDDLKKEVKELEKKKDVVPMTLMFCKAKI